MSSDPIDPNYIAAGLADLERAVQPVELPLELADLDHELVEAMRDAGSTSTSPAELAAALGLEYRLALEGVRNVGARAVAEVLHLADVFVMLQTAYRERFGELEPAGRAVQQTELGALRLVLLGFAR